MLRKPQEIEREVKEILASGEGRSREGMSWESSDPLLRNWRVETRATADPAAVGSRWEAVSGTPSNPSVTGTEARSLYARLVSSGRNHVRLMQRHPRDAHLERVVASTESDLLSEYDVRSTELTQAEYLSKWKPNMTVREINAIVRAADGRNVYLIRYRLGEESVNRVTQARTRGREMEVRSLRTGLWVPVLPELGDKLEVR